MLGIDYSARPPSPAAIRAGGFSFAVRYLSTPGNPKNLTAREAAALLAAGIDIGLVWEQGAARAISGDAGGTADGAAAAAIAKTLGAPPATAIYYAVDFDAGPADFPAIAAYLAAAARSAAPHPVGVYGGVRTVAEIAHRGAATYFWQTGAWSGGRRFPGAHLYQRIQQVNVGGTSCDVNESWQDHWGSWLDKPEFMTTGDFDMAAKPIVRSDRPGTQYAVLGGGRVAHPLGSIQERDLLVASGVIAPGDPVTWPANEFIAYFGDV